jgi:hypothetical protein
MPQKFRQVRAVLTNTENDLVVHCAKVVDRWLNWLGVNFPDVDSFRPLGFDETRVGRFWPEFALTFSQSLLQTIESEMGHTPFKYNEKFAHAELICELAYEQCSI